MSINSKRPKVTAEAGRALWTELLARVATPNDRHAEQFLHWIIESMVIDLINTRIVSDDVFAQSLGERIQKLFEAERSRGGPSLTA